MTFQEIRILTQNGEFGRNVDINVYVYSIPKYTTQRWYKGNTTVSSSTKYVMLEGLAMVNDTFHGKDVQLDGYSVVLTFQNLKEPDFNVSYRSPLWYGASQTVQYTVLLESTSKYLKSEINTIKIPKNKKQIKQTNKQTNKKEKKKRKSKIQKQYCTWLQMVRFLPLIHNLKF